MLWSLIQCKQRFSENSIRLDFESNHNQTGFVMCNVSCCDDL